MTVSGISSRSPTVFYLTPMTLHTTRIGSPLQELEDSSSSLFGELDLDAVTLPWVKYRVVPGVVFKVPSVGETLQFSRMLPICNLAFGRTPIWVCHWSLEAMLPRSNHIRAICSPHCSFVNRAPPLFCPLQVLHRQRPFFFPTGYSDQYS